MKRHRKRCWTGDAVWSWDELNAVPNRHIYEFDETEIRTIVRALREAVGAVEGRFASLKGRTGGGFKL